MSPGIASLFGANHTHVRKEKMFFRDLPEFFTQTVFMSYARIQVHPQTIEASQIQRVRRTIPGIPVHQIKEIFEEGLDLHKADLFLNDHDDVAKVFSQIIELLDAEGFGYQVFEGADGNIDALISSEILMNILSNH